jgi:hypothetical protein
LEPAGVRDYETDETDPTQSGYCCMVTYRTQSLDTTPEAEAYLFNLWRSWSLQKKLAHLNYSTYSLRSTTWYFAKVQYGSLGKEQIVYFLKKIGESFLLDFNTLFSEKLIMIGVLEEALIVAQILESLGISYFIGGSVASGVWGELRYTQDLDLVADIKVHQVEDLVKAFSPRFYLSDTAIREAIEHKRSFNLIDNDTAWKIDIFILSSDPFHQSEFQRRQQLRVDDQGNLLYFTSVEDIILQKFLWYHLSQKQSEQQWRDILGILKLQKDRLDFPYLEHWARLLEVYDDLIRSLAESGYASSG